MKKQLFGLTLLFTSLAPAEIFTLDAGASRIEWKAGKKVGDFHQGTIQVKSGEVETTAKGLLKTALVTIDMKTIANEDLKDSPEYQKKLVEHLAGDDFFKVEKFPESSFKLLSIKQQAGAKDSYSVKGELTLLGITKPIEFPAIVTVDSKSVVGQAEIKVARLNWGLQYGSGSIFKTLTADKIINDEFELKLKLVAVKKQK